MSGSEWSLHHAGKRLDALIVAAEEGGPQVITSESRAVAVVLAWADYERLAKQETADKPDFIQHILAAPKRPPQIPDDEELFPREPFRGRDLDLLDDDR